MNDLWIDFVNSDYHDHRGQAPHRDHLAEPEWIAEFLRKRGLPAVDARAPAVRSGLQALRSQLMETVQSLIKENRVRPAHLKALNQYLAARPVISRLEMQDEEFRLRLAPDASGLDAVNFAIAESFAGFLVEGDPTRLKACENPDCGWVFYDTTRSRTRRWCADTCGNLIKVRRFRQEKSRSNRGKRRG